MTIYLTTFVNFIKLSRFSSLMKNGRLVFLTIVYGGRSFITPLKNMTTAVTPLAVCACAFAALFKPGIRHQRLLRLRGRTLIESYA